MLSQHPVKPTIGRPLSKPRSHNPLINSIRSSAETAGASSGSDNSPVEETVLSKRNNKFRSTIYAELLKDKIQVHNGLPVSSKIKKIDADTKNSQESWGEDFEDIFEDEFEGNSLCSSVASLLYKEHDLSKNGDLVSSCLWQTIMFVMMHTYGRLIIVLFVCVLIVYKTLIIVFVQLM